MAIQYQPMIHVKHADVVRPVSSVFFNIVKSKLDVVPYVMLVNVVHHINVVCKFKRLNIFEICVCIAGCEHNGQYYKDGERIHNAESPCYSCYCQGSSITCSLADCQFRFDCEPEYVLGECCPRYDHCPLGMSFNDLKLIVFYLYIYLNRIWYRTQWFNNRTNA